MADSTNPSLGGHVIQWYYLRVIPKITGGFRVIAPFTTSDFVCPKICSHSRRLGCSQNLLTVLYRIHSRFQEIYFRTLLLLANLGKYHMTCQVDTTGHEWFGRNVLTGGMVFA